MTYRASLGTRGELRRIAAEAESVTIDHVRPWIRKVQPCRLAPHVIVPQWIRLEKPVKPKPPPPLVSQSRIASSELVEEILESATAKKFRRGRGRRGRPRKRAESPAVEPKPTDVGEVTAEQVTAQPTSGAAELSEETPKGTAEEKDTPPVLPDTDANMMDTDKPDASVPEESHQPITDRINDETVEREQQDTKNELNGDAAIDNTAPVDMTNEDTANEDAVKEGAANESAVDEDVADKDARNRDAGNEDTANENIAKENTANEEKEDAANDDDANEDVANRDAMNEDAVNDGIANEDTVNDGTANEDTANEDTTNEDTTNEDTTNDGTANDGTANDGTANDGTANDGTANDGTANEDAANRDAVNKDAANEDAVIEDTVNENARSSAESQPEKLDLDVPQDNLPVFGQDGGDPTAPSALEDITKEQETKEDVEMTEMAPDSTGISS